MKFLQPDWSVSPKVKAIQTIRMGGFSELPYESLNLATHVDDDPETVLKNRQHLKEELNLPSEPLWLNQVHGTVVVDEKSQTECDADAFYTDQPNQVGVVMTADCLPVFMAADDGNEVAVAHAGWRGLLNGVIENSLTKFKSSVDDISIWLGPAIGPEKFEVGEEVFEVFDYPQAFREIPSSLPIKRESKYLADIYALARHRLSTLGISKISGGKYCTVSQSELFFSYRRDGVTGRMASLIWIDE